MGETLATKILSRASGGRVEEGDIVEVEIDFAMIHDITGPPAIRLMKQITKRVWDPSRVIIPLDHLIPAPNERASKLQLTMFDFAREQGIENIFYGEGICHQVVVERGFARPGKILVGSDSHTCTAGALGCFATGIGSTDMAMVLATGKLWMRVPETILVKFEGDLPRGVFPKDMALAYIGELGADGATYKSIEFSGSTVRNLTISGRLTLSNMAVEAGAKTGLIAPDEKTIEYLGDIGLRPSDYELIRPDEDASYEDILEIYVDELEPLVSAPHSVDNVKPVGEVAGEEITQAFLGSCTNGRFEDLEVAARILKGRRVKRGVKLIVAPASRREYMRALEAGVIRILLEAGAVVVNPNCACCLGGHQGILADGEICISASNRNFRGRMGSKDARIFLASPATVAASAVRGEITDPRDFL